MMHLGIVSDAHHYRDEKGQLCTLTPLARQFEQWALLFERVTVLAPLLSGLPPSGFGPYATKTIRLEPLPVGGGNSFRYKLQLLAILPTWWRGVRRLLRMVDAVHIRCPNNVGIPALLAVAHTPVARQAVFTGTWMGYDREPLTYRWQRWYLSRRFSGPVAVYGDWPNQPAHVVPSFSPSCNETDWRSEEAIVQRKLDRLRGIACLPTPIKLVTIGSLTKNQDVVIRAVRHLLDRGLEARLDVLGGGPQQQHLQAMVGRLGLERHVHIHGRVAYSEVREHLRAADFAVQAPSVEGFGKVPIEAFFHGCIPILSNVNLSGQLVAHGERGRLFAPGDSEGAADAVEQLSQRSAEMACMIERGRIYSRSLTLEHWREHLKEMLERHWNVALTSGLELA